MMDEFEKHLGAEKFQMYLREELKRYSKFDKVSIAILIPMLVVAILFFLPKFLARFVAWEIAWSPGIGLSRDMNSFWFDQNGDTWLSYSKPFSVTTQIVQVTQEKMNNWSVELSYFDLVIADSQGQPWVIRWDEAMHWVGTSWKTIPYDNYTVSSSVPVVIVNEKYWVSAYSEEKDESRFKGSSYS